MSKKNTVTLPVELKLQVPILPNFILVDGSDTAGNIPVSLLSEEQLRTIGAEWTKALIEKAKKG